MRSNTTALTPFSRWKTSPVRRNLAPDPLPRQHLARGHDDRLLVVGIEVGLDGIAEDDDGAILESRSRRPVDRIDVRHRHAELARRAPLRAELPQFADELAAERIARAKTADLGVRSCARIDPSLETLKFVKVRARRPW